MNTLAVLKAMYSSRRIYRGWLSFILLALLGAEIHAATVPSSNGIYATIRITRNSSLVAELVAELDYDKAPMTVANFVGLAEGSRSWVDFVNGGMKRKPFYDGIVLHRVIAGFVIQGGSPNGQGTDGPGYTFPDEFGQTLRHDAAGVLSMANSGPNSNGSQFFITLDATPHLDDVHSVFGRVVSGQSDMNSVQQGDVIESITITRNGTAAQIFDVDDQGLPQVLDAQPTFSISGSSAQINFDLTDDTEFFVFHTSDFQTWTPRSGRLLYISEPVDQPFDVSSIISGQDRRFFSVGKIVYPIEIQTPYSVFGNTLQLNTMNGFGFTALFSGTNSGRYAVSTVQGQDFQMTGYQFQQEAYRGYLIMNLDGSLNISGFPIVYGTFSLSFSSSSGGSFKGNLLTTNPNVVFPMQGDVFTLQ